MNSSCAIKSNSWQAVARMLLAFYQHTVESLLSFLSQLSSSQVEKRGNESGWERKGPGTPEEEGTFLTRDSVSA